MLLGVNEKNARFNYADNRNARFKNSDGKKMPNIKFKTTLTASHASRVLFISDREFAYLIFNN